MKLEPLVLAANTTELGLTFVDSQGTSIAEFQASPNGPTAELEILRGDFAQILYDATKDSTKWVFGDFITSIDDMHDTRPGPLVKFHSGKQERYDFVIVADGIGSRTRKMVFGDEVVVKPLGLRESLSCYPGCPVGCTPEIPCSTSFPDGSEGGVSARDRNKYGF